MSIIQSTAKSGTGGFYDYPIENSLRFDGSSYLSRTFGTPTNTTKRTISFWVKKTYVDGSTGCILSNPNNGLNEIRFNGYNATANYAYTMEWFENSGTNGLVFPYAKYRDTSSWYHFVCVLDSTVSDSMKVYKNGIEESLVIASNLPTGSSTVRLGGAQIHYIGGRNSSTNLFNGYMANIHFIDGQALDASYFGETKSGVWIPKEYTGSYGTNGFHLTFEDATSTTTLGYDYSGNNNHWTLN